jgi:hypothetical protein
MPLLQNEVFAGNAGTLTSGQLDISASISTVGLKSALISGRQYYLEVLAGPNEGLRLELDESATTGGSIAFESGSVVPASLAGARIAVRAHQTLNDVLPPVWFQAGASASTADRVMFFANGGYQVKWLYSGTGQPHWIAQGDTTLTDIGTSLIGPAAGFIIQPRTALTLPVVGELRTNAFTLPLAVGAQLTGSGWPLAQSPASRGMTIASGFTAAPSSTTADRIRLWAGDATAGATGYTSYFYLAGPTPAWTKEGDPANASVSATPLFTPFRAAFLISTSGDANWKLPVPFTP